MTSKCTYFNLQGNFSVSETVPNVAQPRRATMYEGVWAKKGVTGKGSKKLHLEGLCNYPASNIMNAKGGVRGTREEKYSQRVLVGNLE